MADTKALQHWGEYHIYQSHIKVEPITMYKCVSISNKVLQKAFLINILLSSKHWREKSEMYLLVQTHY